MERYIGIFEAESQLDFWYSSNCLEIMQTLLYYSISEAHNKAHNSAVIFLEYVFVAMNKKQSNQELDSKQSKKHSLAHKHTDRFQAVCANRTAILYFFAQSWISTEYVGIM